MPRSRELPDDLVLQLRRMHDLEHAAGNIEQQRNALAATGALMLAAAEAGWFITDIAAAIGMNRKTASKRINDTRRRRGADVPSGLVIDEPPEVRGPLAELTTALEDRQWLSRAEAATYLGVSDRSIQNYHECGLLPNSRKLTRSRRSLPYYGPLG